MTSSTSSLLERQRTHNNSSLTKADAGREVVLFGWVDSIRDHDGRVFIDLRDRYGITQIVFKPEVDTALRDRAQKCRREYCIGIRGLVEDRVKNGGSPNPRLPTGEVEVSAQELTVFNESAVPPFMVEDNIDTNEEKRLSHRTVDLRRPRLQRNLVIRHKLMQAVRRYLDEQSFLEMETPILVKYTPGGARNFLVPSRLNPGQFYALAESPQLYKQMFMMAGMDRYFQIVKCFRDEDLRGDRQPEFTQVDLEVSFATEKVVQSLVEGLVQRMFEAAIGVKLEAPFQRMTYDEAMARFGSDKPDLRFGMEHVDVTEIVRKHNGGGVKLLTDIVVANPSSIMKVMVLPKKHEMSNTEVDKLKDVAKGLGGEVGWSRVEENGWAKGFGKAVSNEMRAEINAACKAEVGDVIFFNFGKPDKVHTILGGLRVYLRDKLKLVELDENGVSKAWRVLWVTDFPLFEKDDSVSPPKFAAAHHPFTSPQAGHEDKLTSDPAVCKARAYDLVVNGNELGGGSIRIHDPSVQAKVFTALGITDDDAQRKFGFLLEAMKYGCPPHGGIALGLDRFSMLLCGGTSLRDVIAYPKTQKGTDLLTGAPTPVSDTQLKELFIASTAPVEGKGEEEHTEKLARAPKA